MSTENRKATPEEQKEQETRFAQQADKASIERAGVLTERLIQYGMSYAKEQHLSPEELVFAVALYAVNLRETFPLGKAVFDTVASRAAEYYDSHT